MNKGGAVELILMGALFGFTAGISPGPLLSLVIAETIKHNRAAGVKIAIAPLITDLPIITLSILLLSSFSHLSVFTGLISCLGGLFLIYLGYECFRSRGLHNDIQRSNPRSLIKGVLANILNPHPYLYWITVGSPIALKVYTIGLEAAILYFIVFYCLLTGSKIGIAFLVDRSRTFLTHRIYIWIMRILGISLLVFAFIFLTDGIKNLGGHDQ